MIHRVRPADYKDLLIDAVASARETRFWRNKLGDHPVRSQSEFDRLPFTSVDEYRKQSFASVVADPSGIEWIPGPWLGQSPDRVPMSEGPLEATVRVELMADEIRPLVPEDATSPSALVVTTAERRHFGAEVSAALVRVGVQAHLITDGATNRLNGLIQAFEPDIVVALSPAVDLRDLPKSVTGVVTVGRGSLLKGMRHVDMCIQNELGVLGTAFGSSRYELNHHRFHFEESPGGALAATPYFNRVQPIIRLDTGIPASVLN